MIKRILFGAAVLFAGAAHAQGGPGGYVGNAVSVWGQTAAGAPCIVAPAPSGSSTCGLPIGVGGSGVLVSPGSKAQTSALATSVTLKAAPGTLYSFNATADSTLNAAAWYLIIEDATSWGTGAQTPAKCYYVPAGQSTFGGTFASGGVAFSAGITVGVSTTGCFTVTSSAHAFISGDYQ